MAKNRKENINNWESVQQVLAYLSLAKNLPHSEDMKTALLEQIPVTAKRVLDLGTGDGRLLELVKLKNPAAECVGLDFSEPMLKLFRERFGNDSSVKVIKHDLNVKLPFVELGSFDLVVSSLAIHHLEHNRKKQLYNEVFKLLTSKGLFCNLEHVASPTQTLHNKFLEAVGLTPITDDPSNKLLDMETQLRWFREIGFIDVDCCWKWLEVALLVGSKP